MLCTPFSVALMPAGAVQTPFAPSDLAYTPATTPEGAKVRNWPLFNWSASRSRGQNAAPFGSTTPMVLDFQSTAPATVVTLGGGSSSSRARAWSHSVIAAE